jgi:uncharacterized protein YkwD
MDIRTWQDADRADDARAAGLGPGSGAQPSYRARHRSARGPFGPLRPAPIAIGGLSTAAVAAIAFVVPHMLHAGKTASAGSALDGLPGHIAPLTPGPGTPSSGAANQDPNSNALPGGAVTSGPADPSTPAQPQPSTPSTPGAKQTASGPTGRPSGTATSVAPTPPNTTASSSVDQGNQVGGDPTPSSGPGPGTAPGGGVSSSPSAPPSTPTTPPTSSPTTQAPVAFDAAVAQQTALAEINAARTKQGRGSLQIDSLLTKAATQHTADMVKNKYFNHTGSDGSSPTGRAWNLGCWNFTKEVIARGAPGSDFVATLMQDPTSAAALNTWGLGTIGLSAQQDPATGQVLWSIELGWS